MAFSRVKLTVVCSVAAMVMCNWAGLLPVSLSPAAAADPAASDNRIGGEIAEDTTLAGTCVVESDLTVPTGTVLTILPGTTLLIESGVTITVAGQLLAEGTPEQPIRFAGYGSSPWGRMLFIEAADSTLAHCMIEHADSEGAHQDYYGTGLRNYHEAVVALACHLDIEYCTFQNLPDNGAHAEGDAIAIISDDPEHPGEASAHIAGCQFLSIGQGVHTRFSYVLVEDCYFTGKRGDNDDVDLWGESTPPALIRNNVFINPEHDDAINPTRCSARIIGNFIGGTDDHGIVLRDKSSPVVMNNVIFDCANGGIAVENSCTATLINNTIVGCGRGVRLFDLGRWNAPYYLNPGGGTATITNCIIWDCPQPITLADSSNTQIADRGSHVMVSYCDIKGGRDAVSVSGQHSTVTWGQGNIDADPLLADPDALDFHLESCFGRWDLNSESWVTDADTSPCIDAGDPNSVVVFEPFPNGGIVNIGAHGNTPEASKSPSGPMSAASVYLSIPNQGTVVQTGGFAGVHWTYWLKGQLTLTVDFVAGTASLSHVGTSAIDDGPPLRTLDPNEVFNLTALTGTIGNDQSVQFTGKAHDGSDVILTATFQGDLVHLVAQTTPPPGSADFFLFTLDAWAERTSGL
jgi:parallel beta-helix repeat protein